MKTKNDFDIPEGLSPKAREAAEIIVGFAKKYFGEDASGWGCRAFYTPKEWKARGERYGRDAALIVVHDGGDLSPLLDLNYGAYSMFDKVHSAIENIGMGAEQCTSWYTAVYDESA